MRKIYDRYGDVLCCIRDDGDITDKWDVEVVGHFHGDRITDKFDIETLFRISSDGTVRDKWDVDVVGHIRSDGTITDKYDIDEQGKIGAGSPFDAHSSATDTYGLDTFSDGGGYAGGVSSHDPKLPSSHGSRNKKKTICLTITIVIQGLLILAMILGIISTAINESFLSFIIVNLVIFVNALVSGVLCYIARYRIGSTISTVVNAILGIYIFITAITSVEGFITTVLAFLFFGFIEWGVIYVGALISGYFSTKFYK